MDREPVFGKHCRLGFPDSFNFITHKNTNLVEAVT